jgi:hypothetical protein
VAGWARGHESDVVRIVIRIAVVGLAGWCRFGARVSCDTSLVKNSTAADDLAEDAPKVKALERKPLKTGELAIRNRNRLVPYTASKPEPDD